MLSREIDYRSLTTLLDHVLAQWAKHNLHTSMPGVIDSYDVAKRRARVRLGLWLVLEGDSPGEDGEMMERALVVNVPVLWPASNLGTLIMPLQAGDRGTVIFSERGITEFKRTGELSIPDKTRFFDAADAMFLPGDFGHPDLTPADASAIAMQTYDGATHVTLVDGAVVVSAPATITLNTGEATVHAPVIVLDGDVTVTGSLEVEGPALTHQMTNVGRTHTHAGVQSGPARTGPPA